AASRSSAAQGSFARSPSPAGRLRGRSRTSSSAGDFSTRPTRPTTPSSRSGRTARSRASGRRTIWAESWAGRPVLRSTPKPLSCTSSPPRPIPWRRSRTKKGSPGDEDLSGRGERRPRTGGRVSTERPAREAPPAPEAAAGEPASSPRPLSKNARLALAGLFLLAAIGTRFWHLGERPLHHDEAIHAFQSYTLSTDGNWRYDPAYHGPFLYYANALVYKIAGASNTTARVLPALFGLALIGFAWPLSRWIGRPAAIAYALLVLVSPHLT